MDRAAKELDGNTVGDGDEIEESHPVRESQKAGYRRCLLPKIEELGQPGVVYCLI